MRSLLLLPIAFALAGQAVACSCFSPELRLKTGRDTLELATVAVFGAVVAVRADGASTLKVLESFKGPPVGAVLEIAPGSDKCAPPAARPDDKRLVVAFQAPVTTCETYGDDHFLLDAFRSNAGPAAGHAAGSAPGK